MKGLAILAAIAGVAWLMAGAQMIVTADSGRAADYGTAVSFMGVALMCLFVFLLRKVTER